MAEAAFDYDQASDTDIGMHEGERFVIDAWSEGEEWALVRRLRSPPGVEVGSGGQTGYVPFAYLQKAVAPLLPPRRAQPPPPPPAAKKEEKKKGWGFGGLWGGKKNSDHPAASKQAAELAREAQQEHVAGGGDDLFNRFDHDHDGTLSADEFRSARKMFKGREVRRRRLAQDDATDGSTGSRVSSSPSWPSTGQRKHTRNPAGAWDA